MYGRMASAVPQGGSPTEGGGEGEGEGDYVVTLDQVPRWIDAEQRSWSLHENEDAPYFCDPLVSSGGSESSTIGVSKFPVDQEVNSKLYLWRGNPWNLERDAVVNSTNENFDEAQSSPGLYAAAGSGLAEECATLGGCRAGMARITNAYDLPARLLPLYFPRDKLEEAVGISKLPADVGDENGETVIGERKIRIKPLPVVTHSSPSTPTATVDFPVSDVGLTKRRL